MGEEALKSAKSVIREKKKKMKNRHEQEKIGFKKKRFVKNFKQENIEETGVANVDKKERCRIG